jgi:hypothetical protein
VIVRIVMRRLSIVVISTLAILLTTSVTYAQNDPQSSAPTSLIRQDRGPAGDTYWPTPAQEQTIPYHPCQADVQFADGRERCLN